MRQPYRWLILVLSLTALAGGRAWCQENSIQVKGPVKVVQVDKLITVKEDRTLVTGFPVFFHANPGAGLYFWTYPAGVQAVDKGDVLEVLAAPKGNLSISLKSISADLDKDGKFIGFKTKFDSVTVTVGEVPPGPGPVPPEPDPDPPTPDPAPIPRDGLHVLIVEETAERHKLTQGQYAAIFSKAIRDYLNAKTAPDPRVSSWKAWRIYDQDVDLTNEHKIWQDALLRAKGKAMPYLIISNPQRGGGYEGPLPANLADTQKLLEKYGG